MEHTVNTVKDEHYIGTAELARRLRLPGRKMSRLAKEKSLPGVKVNDRWRFSSSILAPRFFRDYYPIPKK